MQVNVKKNELKDVKDEILAVAVMQEKDSALPFPEITKNMRKEEFEGKSGQIYTIDTQNKLSFKKLLLFGLGEEKDFDLDYIRRFAGTSVKYAISLKSDSVSIAIPRISKAKNTNSSINSNDVVQALAEGAVLANYKCIKFKSKKDDYFEVKTANIIANANESGDFENAIKRASILANAQNYVRDVNENPANIATPQMLAQTARDLAKKNNLSITVFEKDDIKKMKMNAILGVNQGSALPPVLAILEYNKDKKLPLYAVVGKGITFDSGGISLKPSKGMQEMKYDKTGAVSALGIIKAVSELKLPIRLIAAFAATENMPGGNAQKPGDIVTAYNGKTIEVLNTDAEGRLILADTLAYVAEKKPEAMIDLATLTGAIIVSLGRNRIGLFSNDDKLANAIYGAGQKTFERVWRMPLDKEYVEMNKADFADIKNIGSEGSEGGSITAAAFLQEFVGDCKWAHLDIAGVDMIVEKHAYLDKGASGIGVRLVVETLENLIRK